MVAPRQVALGFVVVSTIFMICWITIEIVNGDKGREVNVIPYRPVFKAIQDNLQSPPIEQAEIAQDACSAGFSQVILGLWAGLLTSCQCEEDIYPGTCHDNQRFDCTEISRVNPAFYKRWRDKSIDGACPAEYNKQCSKNVCVKSTASCPLISLQIATTDDATNRLQKFTFQKDPTSFFYLIGKRSGEGQKTEAQFINGFRVGLEPPCVLPLYKSARRGGAGFKAEALPQIGCGDFKDLGGSYYNSSVDTFNELKILSDNDIYERVGIAYQQFLIKQNSDRVLYNRGQIPVKNVDCYSNWKISELADELSGESFELYDTLDGYQIWFISLASVAFVLSLIPVIKPQRQLALLAALFIIFVCILQIVQFIHWCDANDRALEVRDLIAKDCLPDKNSPYKPILNDFLKVHDYQYEHYEDRAYAMFYLALFLLLITLVLLVLSAKTDYGDEIDTNFGIAKESKGQNYDDGYNY